MGVWRNKYDERSGSRVRYLIRYLVTIQHAFYRGRRGNSYRDLSGVIYNTSERHPYRGKMLPSVCLSQPGMCVSFLAPQLPAMSAECVPQITVEPVIVGKKGTRILIGTQLKFIGLHAIQFIVSGPSALAFILILWLQSCN